MSDERNLASMVASGSGLRGRRMYFIGVGGSGMSGLAQMYASRGAIVCGSDREESDLTRDLEHAGIRVGLEQTAEALPETDIVVASAAIKPDHPQWMEAERRGASVLYYAEALGLLMRAHTGIAVAGTHGKSSTTAMLGCALTDAGLDPSVIVGATSPQLRHGAVGSLSRGSTKDSIRPRSEGYRVGSEAVPSGALLGEPGLLVAEACEYARNFLSLRPRFASVLNLEADHLDCYGTLDGVIEGFQSFARLLPSSQAGGRLLIGHDGAHRTRVTSGLSCDVCTIGFSPEADYVVSFDPSTRTASLAHRHTTLARWTMQIPGAHMALNAGVALTLATWAGADAVLAAASLSRFVGVDRRMQLMGEREARGSDGRRGMVRVFDDYGHHPTEIDATLRALREAERPEASGGRLICVFQPHQHSRTRHMLGEFASSFQQADVVLVPHIYFVRDSQEERQRVTAADLVSQLIERGVRAMHLDSFEEIVEALRTLLQPEDLLVVMGAGPVWQIGRDYLRSPHEQACGPTQGARAGVGG